MSSKINLSNIHFPWVWYHYFLSLATFKHTCILAYDTILSNKFLASLSGSVKLQFWLCIHYYFLSIWDFNVSYSLVSWQVFNCYIRRLLHPVYRVDPETERTFIVLRRFKLTRHFLGSPPPLILANLPDLEGIMQDGEEEEVVMADNGVIGITNDRARDIKDYAIFDLNAMNIGIIWP